jgi:type 2A phosphatase activator TIP41
VTSEPTGWRLRLDHESKDKIPLEMLGPHNPILHYGEVTLYEDELGDKGFTKVNVRFRVMADCWFVLFRSYTRVDHVLVRILDTRLFCRIPQEGKLEVIRDFQHRESTYTSLKHKGFKVGSEWGLSSSQSDEVYPHLDVRLDVTDKIIAERE